MNTHVEIQNLNAFYGSNHALININMVIPRRRITVIMGPSGCGKTTLLKTINRFFELTDGTRHTGRVLLD
jgi:phosphate transport system ATP-binding protein